MNSSENVLTTKEATVIGLQMLLLLLILVVGIQYTMQNCRRLAHAVRREKLDEARVEATAVAVQLRNSSRASHQQLGEELQSMQQLQLQVASQLNEIKSLLSRYAAVQQQDDTGSGETKQD